jgi:hypothetical protein
MYYGVRLAIKTLDGFVHFPTYIINEKEQRK